MRWRVARISLLLLGIELATLLVGSRSQELVNPLTPGERQCLDAVVLIPDPWGALLSIGEQKLCGRELEFGPMRGPAGAWK